jgi:hypothetical protein
MEEQLSLEFLRVVENAAIAAARTMGFGDRHKADEVAVEAMRKTMDQVEMRPSPFSLRWILPLTLSKARICAPLARPTPSPCSPRAKKAACFTLPTCTWKK